MAIPAPVKWAQRKDLVFLCFDVQDAENPEVKMEKDKITYKVTTKNNQKYENTLNLFAEINVEASKWTSGGRSTEMVLMKEVKGPYWDRLLKESAKYHWLKVDFNRWKDEEDSEDEHGSDNFEEMMRKMGGMSNFGNSGEMPPFNETDDMDDLPDLEDDEKKE